MLLSLVLLTIVNLFATHAFVFTVPRGKLLPSPSAVRAIKIDPPSSDLRSFGGSGSGRGKDDKGSMPLSIREMIQQAGRKDQSIPTMIQMFFTDAVLLNAALILSFMFSVDILRFETTTSVFDGELWRVVFPCFGVLMVASFLATVAPVDPFLSWAKRQRFAALQQWGLTDTSSAVIGHAIVSIFSGIAEEIAFRGFVYGVFENFFGPFPAIAISSLIYSLFHHFRFGSTINPVAKFFQGILYTVAMWFSGGNILVPISLHALYQFVSSFSTWTVASSDLRTRIYKEELRLADELQAIAEDSMKDARDMSDVREFDESAADDAAIRALWNMLDADNSGGIDKDEWSLALCLLGFGSYRKYTGADIKDTNYEQFRRTEESAKNGVITYDQFEKTMKSAKSWPRRETNILDW